MGRKEETMSDTFKIENGGPGFYRCYLNGDYVGSIVQDSEAIRYDDGKMHKSWYLRSRLLGYNVHCDRYFADIRKMAKGYFVRERAESTVVGKEETMSEDFPAINYTLTVNFVDGSHVDQYFEIMQSAEAAGRRWLDFGSNYYPDAVSFTVSNREGFPVFGLAKDTPYVCNQCQGPVDAGYAESTYIVDGNVSICRDCAAKEETETVSGFEVDIYENADWHTRTFPEWSECRAYATHFVKRGAHVVIWDGNDEIYNSSVSQCVPKESPAVQKLADLRTTLDKIKWEVFGTLVTACDVGCHPNSKSPLATYVNDALQAYGTAEAWLRRMESGDSDPGVTAKDVETELERYDDALERIRLAHTYR